MSLPAFATLALGAALIIAAAYRLAAQHDDERATRRRLAKMARREQVRQEQDRHPVEAPSWEPYRRSSPSRPSRALWQVGP